MKVQVCMGKSCKWKFAKYIIDRIENDTKFYGWKWVEAMEEACMWQCKKWPNIKLKNQIINYCNPAKVSEVIQKHLAEDTKKEKNTSKNKK